MSLTFSEEQALISYGGGSEVFQQITSFNYQLVVEDPKAFRTGVEAEVREFIGESDPNKHIIFTAIRSRLWKMNIEKMLNLLNKHEGDLRSIALELIQEFRGTQVPKAEAAMLEA